MSQPTNKPVDTENDAKVDLVKGYLTYAQQEKKARETRNEVYLENKAKLEARFPEDAHFVRDGFTYVDPMHYRERFLEVFTEGYDFESTITEYRPEAIYGEAYFDARLDGVSYRRRVSWSEPWTFSAAERDANGKPIRLPFAEREIIQPDKKTQMSNSAGLKAIARELGVGLYLYEKELTTEAAHSGNSNRQDSQAPRQYAPREGGSGSSFKIEETDTWNVGTAHKGKAISEIDTSYFTFLSGPGKTGPLAEAARAIVQRRSDVNVNQTFENINTTQTTEDSFFPDEVPF